MPRSTGSNESSNEISHDSNSQIPQRVMDLFCLIILIIICSIALACYTLWFDNTLSPYYEKCQKQVWSKEKKYDECIEPQNCSIFADMRTMAIGKSG